MGKLLEGFLAYMQNTPETQILKDWAEVKSCNYEGPTVEQFIEQCWLYNGIVVEPWELNFLNKPQKSEDIFGFFL
jgi:hypothetical protein